MFDHLLKKMWEAQRLSDLVKYSNFIIQLTSQRESLVNASPWEDCSQNLENGNLLLVKTPLGAGADIVVKENCGATPFLLVVIKKNKELSAYLLENFAAFDSNFFSTIPSPHVVAKKLKIINIAKIVVQESKESKILDFSIWKIF